MNKKELSKKVTSHYKPEELKKVRATLELYQDRIEDYEFNSESCKKILEVIEADLAEYPPEKGKQTHKIVYRVDPLTGRDIKSPAQSNEKKVNPRKELLNDKARIKKLKRLIEFEENKEAPVFSGKYFPKTSAYSSEESELVNSSGKRPVEYRELKEICKQLMTDKDLGLKSGSTINGSKKERIKKHLEDNYPEIEFNMGSVFSKLRVEHGCADHLEDW